MVSSCACVQYNATMHDGSYWQFLVEYDKSGGGFHGPCSLSFALYECTKTQAALQSIWCWCPHACSAIAEAFVSPPLTALWCSFILQARERPDCPTYVLSQSPQGILYTTPFCCSIGTGSFDLTNIWRRVRFGLSRTRTSSFSRSLLMVSDSPRMYGSVTVGGFLVLSSVLTSVPFSAWHSGCEGGGADRCMNRLGEIDRGHTRRPPHIWKDQERSGASSGKKDECQAAGPQQERLHTR